MTIIGWLSVALAGTLRVHSTSPVSVKVDGAVVGRMTTDVTLTNVAAGTHEIEVVDALGAVLASTAVVFKDGGDPLWFDYYAHRLMAADLQLAPANAKPISDAAMQSLEVHLAKKKSDVKRMKYFTKYYTNYWYEMRHVDSLLLAFASIEDRIELCRMLAPRTLDPQHLGAIEDHFPQGDFRERAIAWFAAYTTEEQEEE